MRMFGAVRGRPHLFQQKPQKAKDIRRTLRRLLSYMRPYSLRLLFIAILVGIQAGMTVWGPRIVGGAVDTLWSFVRGTLSASEAGALLGRAIIVLALIYGGALVSDMGSFYSMMKVGQKMLFDIRQQIAVKIQSLSLTYFDHHATGDTLSRHSNDTDVIDRVLNRGVVRFSSSLLTLIGIFVSMLTLNWRLALASFSVLPLMFMSTVLFSRRARSAFRQTRKTIGRVSSELEENISGVRVAQAFSREGRNIESFRVVNEANREANVNAETITAAFTPTLDVLSTVGIALVLGYGGYLALQGAISIGIVVTFLQYVRRFFQPVRALSLIWTNIQSAIAGAERIFELLDDPTTGKDPENARPLTSILGRVEFQGVSFSYNGGEPVLEDVSFAAGPGETLALVGATGAGKTTITSLIGRFYEVQKGVVLIDGRDIRELTAKSIRDQLGYVLQDDFLFSDTVMDNILYGRPSASEEEVMEAARLANAHEFIMKLPKGYRTVLTERGSNLSRGQRQLLSIARVILADPRILILDEATSSVDTRTEQLIQKALEHLLKGRTSLVVAHRLSTVRNADLLLVMEKGRIVERGKHEELMAKKGRYYRIHRDQWSSNG